MKKILLVSLVALTFGALSFNVFADRFEGIQKQTTISRSGKLIQDSDVVTAEVSTMLYKIEEKLVLSLEPVEEIECTTEPGEGRGDWKGFFEARGSEKAKALSKAIKGVGPVFAEKLVEGKYFNKKPRSWSDFSAVIKRADENIGGGLAYRVLSQYRDENIVNLGYYSETDCTRTVTYETVLKIVEEKVPYRTVTKQFIVEIEESALLTGESEKFIFTFNGFEDSVSISSDYNSYQIKRVSSSSDRVIYAALGSRLQVTPENTLNAYITTARSGNLSVTFEDVAFDSDLVREMGDIEVEVNIFKNRNWWFDKNIGSFTKRLSFTDKDPIEFENLMQINPGTKVYIQYRIKRLGSKFFNNRFSRTKNSSTVSF